jgi:hypothetical protein
MQAFRPLHVLSQLQDIPIARVIGPLCQLVFDQFALCLACGFG